MKDPADQKIEEILQSLDGIQRATPKPFLLTRINARLNNNVKSIWDRVAIFVARPATAIISLCMLLIVNLSVMVLHKPLRGNSVTEKQVTFSDEEEYSSSFATIDNIENPEQ